MMTMKILTLRGRYEVSCAQSYSGRLFVRWGEAG